MIIIMYSNFAPSPTHVERLSALSDGLPVFAAGSEGDAIKLAADVRIVLGHRYLRQILSRAERLQWVQSTAAGVDHIITSELRHRRPLLTRSTVAGRATALHAMSLAMALMRRLPDCIDQQRQRRRERRMGLPMPRRALVLGMGAIGRELSQLLRALGVRVTGVARSPGPDKRMACDELIVDTSWKDRLPEYDWLFVALPLDKTTRGMVNADLLARLPVHALVVNVARAGCIDLAATAAALNEGRLGGVAIDATDGVPPPADPVWKTPGLIHTPKTAALHPGFQSDTERFIESQVDRYFRGQPLSNVVDYRAKST